MQPGGRADHRVASEGQFLFGGENPRRETPCARSRAQEDRFVLPQLLRDAQHQGRRQLAFEAEHRQPVTGERLLGKNIDQGEGQIFHNDHDE